MPAVSVFHWLASASEKLPIPGLDLAVSVSPWCASVFACVIAAALVATVTLTYAFSLLFVIVTISGLLPHFTNSLQHLLPCLASPIKLTPLASPQPRKKFLDYITGLYSLFAWCWLVLLCCRYECNKFYQLHRQQHERVSLSVT